MPESDLDQRIEDAIQGAVFEFGGLLANELNIYLNREDLVVSRKMQDSIEFRVRRESGDLEVLVGPTIEYAEYVHEGTKPHFPPPAELIDWVDQRGFASGAGTLEERAELLAWHIFQHGTEPNPFLDRFNQQKGDQFAEKFSDVLQKRIDIGN